jgi:DNA-binding PucR family transcriptional regulator
VGLVLWHDGDPDEAGLLERVAGRLARVAGAPRAFVLPAGATTAWAWLSTGSPPDADALRAALAQEPGDVRVAVGLPSGGAAGFRRTHLQALEVQGLARRRPRAERVIRYQDVEAVVVAGADAERARRFVETTLGPLLGEREVLRETLRVHLQEQASATRAAKRLFTHRNTVLKRVARAEALLPRPWQERALAVALALELDHWLPPADGGHEDGR